MKPVTAYLGLQKAMEKIAEQDGKLTQHDVDYLMLEHRAPSHPLQVEVFLRGPGDFGQMRKSKAVLICTLRHLKYITESLSDKNLISGIYAFGDYWQHLGYKGDTE